MATKRGQGTRLVVRSAAEAEERMGLDIVEFVMEVEEAFGLRIPDDVATSLTTPRQLINYLHSRLPQSQEPRCLSQRAFYAVRRELAHQVHLPPAPLRPTTELLAVLPADNAQAAWVAVGESLGYPQWPRVRGRGWLAKIFLRSRPRTLGEAARHVATYTPQAVKPSDEGWSWTEVATVVNGLMQDQLAVGEYSLDDRFVEDLRLY
jgi:hypothetical protein